MGRKGTLRTDNAGDGIVVRGSGQKLCVKSPGGADMEEEIGARSRTSQPQNRTEPQYLRTQGKGRKDEEIGERKEAVG